MAFPHSGRQFGDFSTPPCYGLEWNASSIHSRNYSILVHVSGSAISVCHGSSSVNNHNLHPHVFHFGCHLDLLLFRSNLNSLPQPHKDSRTVVSIVQVVNPKLCVCSSVDTST